MFRKDRMAADDKSQSRHRREDAQASQGRAATQAGVEEDRQEGNGDRIVVQDYAPQQQPPAGGIVIAVGPSQRHSLDEGVDQSPAKMPMGNPLGR